VIGKVLTVVRNLLNPIVWLRAIQLVWMLVSSRGSQITDSVAIFHHDGSGEFSVILRELYEDSVHPHSQLFSTEDVMGDRVSVRVAYWASTKPDHYWAWAHEDVLVKSTADLEDHVSKEAV